MNVYVENGKGSFIEKEMAKAVAESQGDKR